MSTYRELFEQGRFERCEKKCRKAISVDASDFEARITLVLALLEQEKFQPAGAECRKAIKRVTMSDRQKGAFYNLLADADRNLGRHEEAIKWYGRSNSYLGNQPGALYGAIQSHLELNQLDDVEAGIYALLNSKGDISDGMLGRA